MVGPRAICDLDSSTDYCYTSSTLSFISPSPPSFSCYRHTHGPPLTLEEDVVSFASSHPLRFERRELDKHVRELPVGSTSFERRIIIITFMVTMVICVYKETEGQRDSYEEQNFGVDCYHYHRHIIIIVVLSIHSSWCSIATFLELIVIYLLITVISSITSSPS